MNSTPLVGFVGYSDSGKTTLVTALIAHLSELGFRVGAVKHHRRTFDIDHEGKDSWRFTRAGARKTIITGPRQTALVETTEEQRPLDELAEEYLKGLDLILVEGFKLAAIPKIEIQRAELGRPLLCREERHDPDLIAVVSDRPLQLDVPVFLPDDISGLAAFICRHFDLRPSL
ncbi:MAG: molybdopterin-guanine dinucleotide biosynthesis protein B [Deltaproteobacteria bacterium]|nr:molybdopterin-guanine dinucleotide biosynthesis protein B [Deltaproteobacteria bacterium]